MRVRSPWPGRIIEVNADRGCGRAASQQARPGAKIGKIEQRIGAAQSDLPRKDRGVLGTGAAGDDRSGVAEHRGAQLVGELVEILVADREGQRVLAGLRENERKTLGGE